MVKHSPPLPAEPMITVGVIIGAHGVRGEVKVKSFTDDPDAMFDYGPLCTEAGQVLLTPTAARPAKDHYIVTAAEPRQKEAWDGLRGTRLYVPRSALPEADEDEFYLEDLIGLTALNPAGATLGEVKAVYNHGAGDLLEIRPSNTDKTVLVPFTKLDVPTINLAAKTLEVAAFELWADDSKPTPD